MLVLHRLIGEKIIIGENIEVTVLQADRKKVKLGITAPKDVSVDREEVRIRKNELTF